MLIPWKYLKEQFNLSSVSPLELTEKLTYRGLETNLVKKDQEIYLEFIPLPNRSDLSSPAKIIKEISILLNWQVNSLNILKEKNSPLIAINISHEFIEKKIGQKLSVQVIENLWQQLHFSYQRKEQLYQITLPAYRSDITLAEDLVEELLKIYDYNQIKGSFPHDLVSIATIKNNNNYQKKRELRNYLTNNGWQEIITYSLISHEMKEDFPAHNKYYELLMPKNEYHKYYRQTLLTNHLETLNRNLIYENKNLFFFEIGSVYSNSRQEELLTLSSIGKIINQPLHKLVQEVDFYWIKGILENIFSAWKIEKKINFSFSTLDFLETSQSTEIFLDQEKIGFLGQLIPSLTNKYQINEPVWGAEISLTKLWDYLNKFCPVISYQAVSNFPVSKKDLSFFLPLVLDYNQVVKVIKKIGGSDLREVNIGDVYHKQEWAKLGQKSVTFYLIFQSATQTLEKKELDKLLVNISQTVEKLFNGKLRS